MNKATMDTATYMESRLAECLRPSGCRVLHIPYVSVGNSKFRVAIMYTLFVLKTDATSLFYLHRDSATAEAMAGASTAKCVVNKNPPQMPSTDHMILNPASHFDWACILKDSEAGENEAVRSKKVVLVVDSIAQARTGWDRLHGVAIRRWLAAMKARGLEATVILLSVSVDASWRNMPEFETVALDGLPDVVGLTEKIVTCPSHENELHTIVKYLTDYIKRKTKTNVVALNMTKAAFDHVWKSLPNNLHMREDGMTLEKHTLYHEERPNVPEFNDKEKCTVLLHMPDGLDGWLHLPSALEAIVLGSERDCWCYSASMQAMVWMNQPTSVADLLDARSWAEESEGAGNRSVPIYWFKVHPTHYEAPADHGYDPAVLIFLALGLFQDATPTSQELAELGLSEEAVQQGIAKLRINRAVEPAGGMGQGPAPPPLPPHTLANWRLRPEWPTWTFRHMLISAREDLSVCLMESAVVSHSVHSKDTLCAISLMSQILWVGVDRIVSFDVSPFRTVGEVRAAADEAAKLGAQRLTTVE
ncbi:hypothetical protein F4778DRAFT_735803 [Xylariomycetidae sp. FL2044]|nr:hypothetical protein F4778DRAFT_735803 [Xylariomycetidae sp. FL2044]